MHYDDGKDTAAATALAAKADVTIVFVATTSSEGADRTTLSLGDDDNKLVAALTAATGWTPSTSLEDGLAETLRWYRAHGWL